MVVQRLVAYRDRIRSELEQVVAEETPSNDIAASFAVGSFVTMLPTLGTGVAVIAAIGAVSSRMNTPAMFSSVVVFNPFVKWGVYAGSFSLGSFLLGPIPGVTTAELSLSAGPDVLTRLLLGNFLLAVVAAGCGYWAVARFVRSYHRRNTDVSDLVPLSR
jgi:uncharacterized protein (DUF2062 family)